MFIPIHTEAKAGPVHQTAWYLHHTDDSHTPGSKFYSSFHFLHVPLKIC